MIRKSRRCNDDGRGKGNKQKRFVARVEEESDNGGEGYPRVGGRGGHDCLHDCLHLRSIARDSAGDDSIGLGVGAVQLLGVTAPGMSWTR